MAKTKLKEGFKRQPRKDEIYTDILEERFMKDGEEMVKKTYMNKDKVVKEEVVKD